MAAFRDTIGHNGGPPLELRWYQEEAVQSLFNFFNTPGQPGYMASEPANPLVCLPTGTGKSIVIAEFIRRALMMYPGTRVMMSTHVKELIKQNAKKMQQAWPLAPLGIYSSGLKQREHTQPIIFGGVQSCVNKFPMFGRRDLLIVDEAHLISNDGDTRYLKFINELKNGTAGCDPNSPNINPYLKVIGLTATPYRIGLGHMTNGPIFTHVAYDLCNLEGFGRLMADGFIAPLIARPTDTTLDVSKVSKSAEDFNQTQLQAAVDDERITFAALKECCEKAYDRACWLVFASGVEHSEHIAEMLNNIFGISAATVHSKNSDKVNEANLAAWKEGKIRAIVSMNALTTGVDHPPVDFIAMLRPTMSTGLWVQMLGRGTRPYSCYVTDDPILREKFPYIKYNCLVLDFAGNTKRLGPINDPLIPRPKGSGPPGDSPIKQCPKCRTFNHTSARFCIVCGEEFVFDPNISKQSSGLDVMRSDMPQIERYGVTHCVLTHHKSKHSGRDSIKVTYLCGMRSFYEYISVETPVAFHRHKSRDWFRQRYHYQTANLTWDDDVPKTNQEVLNIANQLRSPKQIEVWINKENPEIVGYEF